MVVQVQTNAILLGVLMVVPALAHSNIQNLRFKRCKRNEVVYARSNNNNNDTKFWLLRLYHLLLFFTLNT